MMCSARPFSARWVHCARFPKGEHMPASMIAKNRIPNTSDCVLSQLQQHSICFADGFYGA